jgi:hypothetical protein
MPTKTLLDKNQLDDSITQESEILVPVLMGTIG